jgi:hypothetical protein
MAIELRSIVAAIVFAIIALLSQGLSANESVGSSAGTRMTSGNLVMDASLGQVVAGVSGDIAAGFLSQMAVPRFIPGDSDGNGVISISDAVVIINFIFGGGPAPSPIESGDADCSGGVSIGDSVYLINYIFGGGPSPVYCR